MCHQLSNRTWSLKITLTLPARSHVLQVLEKAQFNKYENMTINVLTIFQFENEEALRTVMLDFLIDGAMFITPTGLVAGSGISVLDLAKGSRQGGKKTQAASSAAQGDGEDESTRAVTIKLSEDDAQDKLSKDAHPKVTMFNGALGAEPGGKEGYKIPLRDPTAPVVTDEEFVRLAQDGHVNGVETFLAEKANQGRVDVPKGMGMGVSGGVVGCEYVGGGGHVSRMRHDDLL